MAVMHLTTLSFPFHIRCHSLLFLFFFLTLLFSSPVSATSPTQRYRPDPLSPAALACRQCVRLRQSECASLISVILSANFATGISTGRALPLFGGKAIRLYRALFAGTRGQARLRCMRRELLNPQPIPSPSPSPYPTASPSASPRPCDALSPSIPPRENAEALTRQMEALLPTLRISFRLVRTDLEGFPFDFFPSYNFPSQPPQSYVCPEAPSDPLCRTSRSFATTDGIFSVSRVSVFVNQCSKANCADAINVRSFRFLRSHRM